VLPAELPPGVRPTSSRAREAIFNMLGNDLEGWSFADLCAGSGCVGLEAASRGAAPVTLVERDASVLRVLRANAAAVGFEGRVLAGDGTVVEIGMHDVVFVDPPYEQDIGPWILAAARSARRTVIAEARAGTAWPSLPGFLLSRDRRYGDAALALYERVGADAGAEEARGVGEDGDVIERDG
jgi:16S rRNA (guanine966-N2)-methyltransferase